MDQIRIAIENGAMLDAPIYEGHKRGKNWMAVISSDPKAPNGLGRRFMEKGRGDYYYMIAGLKVGDPVEFGADYYSGSGRRSAERWYGVVLEMSATEIVLEKAPDARAAIQRASEIVPEDAPSPLAQYSTDDLLAELRRRGFVGTYAVERFEKSPEEI